MQPSEMPLRDIVAAFRETYCGSVGVEFLHIQNKESRRWLIERMESSRNKPSLDQAQRRIILEDLIGAESLERALHVFFMGQKRFSLEGAPHTADAWAFLTRSWTCHRRRSSRTSKRTTTPRCVAAVAT